MLTMMVEIAGGIVLAWAFGMVLAAAVAAILFICDPDC
jgi:hypothetical protein